MATQNKVMRGSRRCRDCGGETTSVPGLDEVWCLNTDPKPACRSLSITDRSHCEHCGRPGPGPGPCPDCGRRPL